MKCWSSESFNSVFIYVTVVLPYSKKTFLTWTEYSDIKCWLTKLVWLFQSTGEFQQLFCWCFTNSGGQNRSSIAGRSIESQMLYISQQSCLLHYGDHYIPCFLIVLPHIGLRWFIYAVIIFLIYLFMYISTVKHLKQNKWFNK